MKHKKLIVLVITSVAFFAIFQALFSITSKREKETIKEGEMDYSVLLLLLDKVDTIEFHDEEEYALVTFKGVITLANPIRYKVDMFTDYLRDEVNKYDIKVIEPEEPEKETWKDLTTSERAVFLVLLLIIVFAFIRVILDFVAIIRRKFKKDIGVVDNGRNSSNLQEIEEKVSIHFSDVAGLEEEIEELKEVVDFLKNPEKYRRLGAKVPRGILLHGQPGTGKTLLAKAVAGEADVAFITASGSEFVNKYVGTGAANVRKLFKEARKNTPCIIFIDEIDAVGCSRTNENDGGDTERNQTINQLLTEMDGFEELTDIIVMAATNRPELLDSALTRPGRFDRIIHIGLPDVKGREAILKIHSRNKPLQEDVDLKEIAKSTSGFSGAQLENLLNEAALVAARKDHQAIAKEDLDEAFHKITVGIKKKARIISDKEKLITATHEAGHAIVSISLPSQPKVKEVSIVPHGTAGGYTLNSLDEDKSYMSKQELLDRLTVLMAGRSAEQIFIRDISTGASKDIEQATKISSLMISVFGMGEAIGPISIKGAENGNLQLLSRNKLNLAGDEIVSLVNEAEERAKKIIIENKSIHQKLVQMLLEKETVTGEEVLKLYNQGVSVDNTKH